VSLCVWAASQPADVLELRVIAVDNIDDQTLQGAHEQPQSAVGVNSVDTRDQQLYSVIEDDTPAVTSPSDTAAAPPVYQLGSCGYYEDLITPLNEDAQRSSAQTSSVYDKLSVRGFPAETLLKRPYSRRAGSVPVCRFPNTI